MKSIKLSYKKSSKKELLKYGGAYEGFASIYNFSPFLNATYLTSKISSEFISGDRVDAMKHFDSIVKDYIKNLREKTTLLSYQIDKIKITRRSVLEK